MARRPRRLVAPGCPTMPAGASVGPLADPGVSAPMPRTPMHAPAEDAPEPMHALADDA